jgi:hypothetical protein
MPAKSKRRKGKYVQRKPQRKPQGNVAASQSVGSVQQSAMVNTAPVTKEAGPRKKAGIQPAAAPIATPTSYLTTSNELRTIGIIGGSLLIALIIIAIFLA